MISPRRTVTALEAYTPPLEGRRSNIRLDFNENTVGFPWAYHGLESDWLTAYPEYSDFLEALSQAWQVPQECLMLTNGSDEGLFVIAFTFIEPNEDRAIVSSPTFPLIPHYLKLVQSQLCEVPVTSELTFDLPGIEAALQQGAKLAIFASPENPTGATLELETVERWCRAYPDTLFVIDEAYTEYAQTSVQPLLGQVENLLITRTFSKAWGLAGLRLGVVMGNPQLLQAMHRVRSPYSVNTVSLLAAQKLLARQAEVLQEAQATMHRKAWVLTEVEQRGYRVVPGKANFFLMGVGLEAESFCGFCKAHGVLVRNRSSLPKLWGMVRVSIGTQAEMERFVACLDAFRESHVLMFDMDGTLVDTTKSFDATIETLVAQYSEVPLAPEELRCLRAEGGFNDDWDATVELLRRRGVSQTYEAIQQYGTEIYLSLASQHETWLFDHAHLKVLKRRYRLGVATGRFRQEYAPVWQDRMENLRDPLFETVVCQDDCPTAQRKPAPDLLLAALQAVGAQRGIYVGNAVDDMRAAQAAGLRRIAVTTTHDEALLRAAGAEYVISSLNELGALLMP